MSRNFGGVLGFLGVFRGFLGMFRVFSGVPECSMMFQCSGVPGSTTCHAILGQKCTARL